MTLKGSHHRAIHIRFKTELVKKTKDLLEYVIVHEMIHPLEPTHSDKFTSLLTEHYPTRREARAELNELLLSIECGGNKFDASIYAQKRCHHS